LHHKILETIPIEKKQGFRQKLSVDKAAEWGYNKSEFERNESDNHISLIARF